jgi:hypothetical protein
MSTPPLHVLRWDLVYPLIFRAKYSLFDDASFPVPAKKVFAFSSNRLRELTTHIVLPRSVGPLQGGSPMGSAQYYPFTRGNAAILDLSHWWYELSLIRWNVFPAVSL